MTASARTIDTREVFFAAGILALALVVQVPFVRHQAVLLDEGVILQMADDILNGKLPYRDAVHYAFPGIFYLTAAVFKVFGPSVEAARMLAATLFALSATAMTLIARWWCTRTEALAFLALLLCYRVWAFPHWHMLNYSPLAVTMALIATWMAGQQLYRQGRLWGIGAGVFCALAILSKQDSGGTTTIALGLGLLLIGTVERSEKLRRAFSFGTTTVAVVLFGFALSWWAGFLFDMLREGLYGPLYGVANYDYLARPSLLPLFEQDQHLRANRFSYFPQILMEAYGKSLLESRLYQNTGLVDTAFKIFYHAPWILVLTIGAATLRRLFTNPNAADRYRALVVLVALAFLAAFNPPHDWVHLLVLYPPTLLLLASGIPMLRSYSLVRALAIAGLSVLVVTSAHLALEMRRRHSTPVATERGTFYTQAEHARGFHEILAALKETPPDTPLAAYPYHPFLNFLAARPSISRYLFLWPIEWNENRDEEIIAALESKPETTVLYSPSQLLHLGPPQDFAPKLFAYLSNTYEIAERYGSNVPALAFLRLRRQEIPSDISMAETFLTSATVTKQPKGKEAFLLDESRGKNIKVTNWPFRATLAVKTQPAAEVAVRIPITPRAGQRLETAFTTNPDRWQDIFLPPVRFRLAIRTASGDVTLREQEVKSASRSADRQWFDVSADLSPWAGQEVELVFGVYTEWLTKPALDLAGWEIPRIVTTPRNPDSLK